MPARLSAAALFLALTAAAPAAAQGRAGHSADPATDPAAGPAAADPAPRSVDSARFQGAERSAVERCAPQVERFGRIRVDEVSRHGSGWRVHGTVAGAAIGGPNGWRRGFAPRAFTCTVSDDGRVRLKTSRLRLY
jgi:hypothetical protein